MTIRLASNQAVYPPKFLLRPGIFHEDGLPKLRRKPIRDDPGEGIRAFSWPPNELRYAFGGIGQPSRTAVAHEQRS